MSIKGSALQEVLGQVEKKPKVHKIPAKKESKGNIEPSSFYYPPTLYLSEKDFPGVENYRVGQKVQLAITVEVTGLSMREESKGKRFNCDMKLTEISDITPRKGA